MLKLLNALAVFILINCININTKVIIWDLQNILFKTNNFKAFAKIGLPSDFLSYKKNTGQKLDTLQPRTFDVLDQVKISNNSYLPKATEKGRILPLCMRSWLAGLSSGQEIIRKSEILIDELDKKNYFTASIEKKLIGKTINFMFNKDKMPYVIQPISSAVRILKKCYKCGNQLFILSNWSSDGFENLYSNTRNRCVFKYFDKDNIIISGDLGMIKPDVKIFSYVINKYNLNPADCIFIDNDILNTQAAESVGIQTILVKNHNFHKLKRDLKNLGVIN